jgi:hypothetical protein
MSRSLRLTTFILGILLAVGSAQGREGMLRPLQPEFDFGAVAIDFRILVDFKFVNYGTTDIRIDTADVHCDCSEARFVDSVVAPNDTATVRVIFNTADFYGPVSKSLSIRSTDPITPNLQVWYHATVGQWIYSVQPTPVSLLFLPAHKQRTLKLQNHSLDFLEIDHIDNLDNMVSINVLKGRVEKGEQIELEVTADPELGPGEHLTNFTLQFKVPAGLEPLRVTIPVKIVRF